MAKVRNNIIIQGLSGSLGDQLVIKQDKAGRTIVAVPPSVDPNRKKGLMQGVFPKETSEVLKTSEV